MIPFSAIVGQEEAKLALIIAAVDPSIGGVLLTGVKGTGKSTIARGLSGILPDIETIEGCKFGCSPTIKDALCDECREKLAKGEANVVRISPKVVSVPLGTTEDRLLGTIDIEKMLKTGEAEFLPGVLAEANGRILYIDEVNLLPDNITDDILDVSASGVNRVEREGFSIEHPARFTLVGTMNPEEGQLRPQILDRFALSVKIETIKEAKSREEIVKRALIQAASPVEFENTFHKANHILKSIIETARERLSAVKLPNGAIKSVARAMSELGVDGQRPDIVIIKSAIAFAALEGDSKVEQRHILKVAPLAVCHRTRNGGFDPPPDAETIIKTITRVSDKDDFAVDGLGYFGNQVFMGVLDSALAAIKNSESDLKKNV